LLLKTTYFYEWEVIWQATYSYNFELKSSMQTFLVKEKGSFAQAPFEGI